MNSRNIAKNFSRAGNRLQKAFPVTITIDGVDLAAHRWNLRTGSTPELAGLLADYDVTFYIARSEIASKLPSGFKFHTQRTRITEAGQSFRVENISSPNGDPRLTVHCKNV